MFIFTIDTDQYAGNFERDLTAYCTGHIGECGVGAEKAEIYEDEEKYRFNNILQKADDHGWHRPCYIYPTPGFYDDGMGGVYTDESDMNIVLENYKKSCIDYKEQGRHNYIRWDKEGNTTKNVEQLNKEIEDIKKLDKINKYESYQSVAIYFNTKPTKKQIEIIKRRSAEYCDKLLNRYFSFSEETIKILGYRLLEEKVVTTLIEMKI